MNYNKFIFHEDLWPDAVGRTLTFNCKRYELELKTIEGIRSCSITMAECIVFRSRFELSHIDTWAEVKELDYSLKDFFSGKRGEKEPETGKK